MKNSQTTRQIVCWVERINRSHLGVQEYLSHHNVPFSIAQYYRYKKKLAEGGVDTLRDKRSHGNNSKLTPEAAGFLTGYMTSNPTAGLTELQDLLEDRFQIKMSKSGVSRCLKRLGCVCRVKQVQDKSQRFYTMCGGFELIVTLAFYLGWPQSVRKVILDRVEQIKKSKNWIESEKSKDQIGRNNQGQFTAKYNKRRDVRAKRFESIEHKREGKNFQSMSIMSVSSEVIARKCLAALALPVVTNNGLIRSIDGPLGNTLLNLCGFNYKNATMDKFLTELKYVGVSEDLLRDQVRFWQDHWQANPIGKMELPILCYYVDGNTKALWSKKYVKQNKVTMLGRVMGCLEQVFIHDNYGRPIYFETYSGHGPVGEYVLSLFEKIEEDLEGPGARLHVSRAIVLDGANNSVCALRAFASQDKYHYITSLDDNQWSPRKIRRKGRPQRYPYGQATLRDCEIELADSKDKGYLIVARAIEIEWDNGKHTVLLTSLSSEIIGASEIVKAYFDRWPNQELPFKSMKSVASLHRVAGYGKQKVENTRVVERQKQLQDRIIQLNKDLADLLENISREEKVIASLVKKEGQLRARSKIVDGRRVMAKKEEERFLEIGKEIGKRERRIKTLIEPQKKPYRNLQKSEREWMRLQGKETVYKVDVELDQIMTFFRVGFVNLCSYLVHDFLKESTISMARILQSILLLPALIEETNSKKKITLQYNEKDPHTMSSLLTALRKLNNLGVKTFKGKQIEFDIGDIDYHLKSTN
jgi:transposase